MRLQLGTAAPIVASSLLALLAAAADAAAPTSDQGGAQAAGARGVAAPHSAPLVATATPAAAAPLGVSGDVRTNVYLDNDGNRIVSPSVAAEAAVGQALRVNARIALDIMTCASVDVRTAATPKGYFEEGRREASGGVTYQRGLAQTSLGVTGSLEHDYGSVTLAVGWSDEFFQRNTTFALGYSFTESDVRRANDPHFEEDLDSHTATATLTQVLSSAWILQASGWLGVLDGFQSSVYRFVRFANGSAGPERMPSVRVREAAALQLRGALRESLVVGASYRLYGDSWGLLAHSAEAQLSWLPRPAWVVRLRERVHTQRGSPYYQSRFEMPQNYMSIDRELGDMSSHMSGLKVAWQPTSAFAQRRLEIDAKVDAVWQTFDDFPWLPRRRWVVVELGVNGAF